MVSITLVVYCKKKKALVIKLIVNNLVVKEKIQTSLPHLKSNWKQFRGWSDAVSPYWPFSRTVYCNRLSSPACTIFYCAPNTKLFNKFYIDGTSTRLQYHWNTTPFSKQCQVPFFSILYNQMWYYQNWFQKRGIRVLLKCTLSILKVLSFLKYYGESIWKK